MELYTCKKLGKNRWGRRTNEVDIQVVTAKEPSGKCSIIVHGTGDLMHHLVEDTAILMNKIAGQECGNGHNACNKK